MASSFEQLVFEIIATDKNASAAFDKFRSKVDQTTSSVDKSSKSLDANAKQLDKTTTSVDKNRAATDKNAESTAKFADKLDAALPGLGAFAGSGGMGALIGAGVALSPVLATVGAGAAGFGVAAYGAIGPVMKAAQAAGGLQANMHKLNPEQQLVAQGLLNLGVQYHAFEKALEPDVLSVFNRGIQIAGHLMHDVQPIAAGFGSALDNLLGRVDAELQSGQWRSFFSWMGAQVGPDIKLIGNSLIDLLDTLPSLLQDLQPVAVQLLNITDDAAKLIDISSRLDQKLQQAGTTANKSGGFLGVLAGAAKNAVSQIEPGIPAAQGLEKWLGKLGDTTNQKTTPAMKTAKAEAQNYGLSLKYVAQQTTAVMNAQDKALSKQLAYSNSILTAANDAQTLKDKLKASAGQIGLHTQAQRDSFGAANTYIGDLQNEAKQAIASGKGVGGAMKAIQDGLPTLDSAKTKNQLYWEEVRTLVGWLHQLQQIKAIQELIQVQARGGWVIVPGQTGTGGAGHRTLPGGGIPGSMAAGGRVTGGIPGRDSVLGLLMPGEVIVPTSLVRAGAVDHLRGSLPSFASGGVIGSYGPGPVSGIPPWGNAMNLATITAVANATASGLLAAYKAALAAAPAGGGAATSATVRGWILAAMSMVGGVPMSWLGPLETLVSKESGGNPRAFNPQTAGASGEHAMGLWQMIPSTYAAYATTPGGVFSPVSEGIAALRYIMGRYGSPFNIPGLLSGTYSGYDQGGWLPPGLSVAYNGTGHPERVGGGNVYITVNVPPTVNPREAGRQVAEVLLAHTKAGGRLYPSGVAPK